MAELCADWLSQHQERAGRNVIAVDSDLGPIVTRLFDWYASGLYSLKEVAAKARTVGMCYRKSGRPVGVSTIHNMLRNRLYTGSFEWRGEIYEGVHEPLVPVDVWEAVQQILDERSSANTRAKPRRFPFTGLVKCGHCGCALVAQIQKGKYIYYRCSGFRGKCPERFVRQEVLEEHFVDLLRGLRCDEQQFASIRDALEETHSKGDLLSGQTGTFRPRGPVPGTAGTLLRDGLSLLDMGRTAYLQLASLPDEVKQQVLSLVFLRCSWAHGKLQGWFNPPFDIFADYLTERGAKRSSLMTQLSDAFCHAKPEIRLLIARYNAMGRIAAEPTDDEAFSMWGSQIGMARLAV